MSNIGKYVGKKITVKRKDLICKDLDSGIFTVDEIYYVKTKLHNWGFVDIGTEVTYYPATISDDKLKLTPPYLKFEYGNDRTYCEYFHNRDIIAKSLDLKFILVTAIKGNTIDLNKAGLTLSDWYELVETCQPVDITWNLDHYIVRYTKDYNKKYDPSTYDIDYNVFSKRTVTTLLTKLKSQYKTDVDLEVKYSPPELVTKEFFEDEYITPPQLHFYKGYRCIHIEYCTDSSKVMSILARTTGRRVKLINSNNLYYYKKEGKYRVPIGEWLKYVNGVYIAYVASAHSIKKLEAMQFSDIVDVKWIKNKKQFEPIFKCFISSKVQNTITMAECLLNSDDIDVAIAECGIDSQKIDKTTILPPMIDEYSLIVNSDRCDGHATLIPPRIIFTVGNKQITWKKCNIDTEVYAKMFNWPLIPDNAISPRMKRYDDCFELYPDKVDIDKVNQLKRDDIIGMRWNEKAGVYQLIKKSETSYY